MAQKKIEVVEFNTEEIVIPIIGVTPLIVHAWSEKAKKMMRDKQAGIAKAAKHDIRDPEQEFNDARYISSMGWDGFPAAGFKAAMIRGAKMVGMVMTDARCSFFVIADDPAKQLVRIYGTPVFREDMVIIGQGVADLRYRPEYTEWSANLRILYNKGMISLAQIHQLVKAAGYGVGVGEMRPEKGPHSYGCFTLANETRG